MKTRLASLFFIALLASTASYSASFEKEAADLVKDLKMNLLVNLKDEMTKNGPISAIPFCHVSVSSIAKDAAKERVSKYEFGRTSHKLRNEKNAPAEWIKADLKRFEGTFYQKDKEASYPVTGTLPNGKKYYAEPLFVNNQCMACHGEKLTTELKDKITIFYPNDKATGFKLNEFRGLIWVKEKELS